MQRSADRERVVQVASWCCQHLGRRDISGPLVHQIVRLPIPDLPAAMDAVEKRLGWIRSPGLLYRCLEEDLGQQLKGAPGREDRGLEPVAMALQA